MTAASDFKVNDKVRHIRLGDGVVSSTDDGVVTVQYESKDTHPIRPIGKYDADWFRIHPFYLQAKP